MAPEYLAPGVYVEETETGTRPIAGVSTSTTAFVGRAVRGPSNAPTLVDGFPDYERRFGGLAITSPMSYAVRDFFLNGGARALIVRVVPAGIDGDSGGEDGALADADVVGDAAARTGLHALTAAHGIGLVCVPPKRRGESTTSAVWAAALAICRDIGALLILDPDPAWGDSRAEAVERAIAGRAALGLRDSDASHAALYFPCIVQADPLSSGAVHAFPPCGVVAGVIARTDATRGVWTAPAGREATLRGIDGLQVDLTSSDTARLHPLGINVLRKLSTLDAPVVWGGRTMQPASEWKYVNVRRLLVFVERSLHEGTRWAVFEPNDAGTWARIRHQIGAFLLSLFRQGALQGQTPDEAFFVRCDRTTMTSADLDGGVLIAEIGIALVRPAEFVIFRIRHRLTEAGPQRATDGYASFAVRVFWEGSDVPVAGFDDVDVEHAGKLTALLKRGVADATVFYEWASRSIGAGAAGSDGPERRRDLVIARADETGRVVVRYRLQRARGTELHAARTPRADAIAIHRLEIAHDGLIRDPT